MWHWRCGVEVGKGGGDPVVQCAGGGTISGKVQSELVNVTKIYSNSAAFAALRGDGTVRAWGDPRSMLA